jgi:hypothetical protein
MKRILRTTLLGSALALTLSSPLMAKEVASVGEARQELARSVASLVNNPAFDAAFRGQLSKDKAMLSDVLRDYTSRGGPADEGVTDGLRDLERQAIRLRGLDGALDALIDLRVHGVQENQPVAGIRDFWVAAILKDKAGEESLVAYDPSGAEHRFPIHSAPDVPMLIVESESSVAMRAGMQVMNEVMRARGLQSAAKKPTARVASTPEELSILTDIYLADDREPNTAGDAEIFAVVSGVNSEGKAEVIEVQLPWLDHDKRWYTPNQDLITWRSFATNYVNVQLFEDDGDTNFKDLAVSVANAVGSLATIVAPGAPPALIIAGVSKIAAEVIKAMDAKWFQNNADYIDSFYVIERGGNYGTRESPLVGARGWAKMALKPYTVNGSALKQYVNKDQ